MSQPPGFIDKEKPNHVCKLEKAIYGLRQAPKAWYLELSSFLIQYGFINVTFDASLFIYCHKEVVIYFLVYVDYLILIGNDSKEINAFVEKLSSRFSLKDLGKLHYFLGIKAIFTDSGLLLT